MTSSEWKTAAALLLLATAFLPMAAARASIACPVLLTDGKLDQQNVTVTFLNKSKSPIEELQLACSQRQSSGGRAIACHSERGLFYPGESYSVVFTYPGSNVRSLVLSLNAVGMANGAAWHNRRDQPCHTLRIETARR